MALDIIAKTNTYRNLILFGATNRSRFILKMTVFDEMSKLAWKNSRHLTTLPLVSPPCRMGNLIQLIRSTTQIWVVTRHQYGISALVSQPSFGEETRVRVSFVSDKAENHSNERRGNENSKDEEKERRHKRKKQWWPSGLVFISLIWLDGRVLFGGRVFENPSNIHTGDYLSTVGYWLYACFGFRQAASSPSGLSRGRACYVQANKATPHSRVLLCLDLTDQKGAVGSLY